MELRLFNKNLIKCDFTFDELYHKYPSLILEFEDIKIIFPIRQDERNKLFNCLKNVEINGSYLYFNEGKCEFFDICTQKFIKYRQEKMITINRFCYEITEKGNVFCPIRENIIKELNKSTKKQNKAKKEDKNGSRNQKINGKS